MDILTPYQIKRMEEVTRGYNGEAHFEYTMHAVGIIYLTVYNLVYLIDRGGGCVIRRKSDGRGIGSYPTYEAMVA